MPSSKLKRRTRVGSKHIAIFTLSGQKYMVKVWDDRLTEDSENVYIGKCADTAVEVYDAHVKKHSEEQNMNDTSCLISKIEKIDAFKIGDQMFLGAPEYWITRYQESLDNKPFIFWLLDQNRLLSKSK